MERGECGCGVWCVREKERKVRKESERERGSGRGREERGIDEVNKFLGWSISDFFSSTTFID